MRKLVRFLMPIVIAVVLGPLIAGLAVCLFGLAVTILDPSAVSAADLLVMSAIYIAFAYLDGAPIALLAGVLVSLWMIRRPPGLLVVVAAAVAAVGVFWLTATIGWLGLSTGITVRNNLWLTLALAAVAAAVCWLLTRRFAAELPAAV
jgi:hypothetical protein